MLGRLAQLGEHLPYKQRVGGSIPSAPTIYTLAWTDASVDKFYAVVAQLVEQLTCNQ
jgi:hypothetical protein